MFLIAFQAEAFALHKNFASPLLQIFPGISRGVYLLVLSTLLVFSRPMQHMEQISPYASAVPESIAAARTANSNPWT